MGTKPTMTTFHSERPSHYYETLEWILFFFFCGEVAAMGSFLRKLRRWFVAGQGWTGLSLRLSHTLLLNHFIYVHLTHSTPI